jgi:hypothetical protein
MSRNQNPNVVLCKNFNKDNFTTTELQVNDRSKYQFIGYTRYQYGKNNSSGLMFQTGAIKITSHGIPMKPEGKEDSDRSYIKLPLDDEQDSCNELRDMCEQIDEYMTENQLELFERSAGNIGPDLFKKSKKKVSGEKLSSKYEYNPIVRTPKANDDVDSDDEDGEKEEKNAKPQFVKFKFDINYDTKELATNFYVKDPDTGRRKLKRIRNVSELEKLGIWQAEVRLIVSANKIWAAKNPLGSATNRAFGVGFKIVQMEIVPNMKVNANDQLKVAFGFVDDDGNVEDVELENEESDEEVVDTPKKATKSKKRREAEPESDEDDDLEGGQEDEDGDEDDAEEAGSDEEYEDED